MVWISSQLGMRRRKILSLPKYIPITEDGQELFFGQIVCPIICEGDVLGAVVLLEKQEQRKLGEVELKAVLCAANFLGRQMEQ
mgnify:CR=1 FL=1